MKTNLIMYIIVFTLISNVTYSQNVCLCDLDLIDYKFHNKGYIFSGDYECYTEKGILSESGFISNGLIDSTIYYNKNGTIREIIWYLNNKPNTRRIFRKAGRTNLIINLKVNNENKSIEHGVWERFFLNGQINEQKYFEYGKSVGIWKTWNSKGLLITSP